MLENIKNLNLMLNREDKKVLNNEELSSFEIGHFVGCSFKQKIKLFSSKENLSEMLSYSDFDMSDIGKEKTAVFIVIQDEKKTYHPLATTFIKQCYETLIDEAHKAGGKLPIRTNFILDEFANMPPLTDVTTLIFPEYI